MDANRLGRRIRAFRKLKNLKQTEFAKQMDMSVSLFGQVERGERLPSTEQLQKMAEHFQVDVSELIGTGK